MISSNSNNKRKGHRGGARPGAGRRTKYGAKMVGISVLVRQDQAEWLAQRSRSAALRAAIDAAMLNEDDAEEGIVESSAVVKATKEVVEGAAKEVIEEYVLNELVSGLAKDISEKMTSILFRLISLKRANAAPEDFFSSHSSRKI